MLAPEGRPCLDAQSNVLECDWLDAAGACLRRRTASTNRARRIVQESHPRHFINAAAPNRWAWQRCPQRGCVFIAFGVHCRQPLHSTWSCSKSSQIVIILHIVKIEEVLIVAALAEWLRRWPAKPLCYARVGSSPSGCDSFFCFFVFFSSFSCSFYFLSHW